MRYMIYSSWHHTSGTHRPTKQTEHQDLGAVTLSTLVLPARIDLANLQRWTLFMGSATNPANQSTTVLPKHLTFGFSISCFLRPYLRNRCLLQPSTWRPALRPVFSELWPYLSISFTKETLSIKERKSLFRKRGSPLKMSPHSFSQWIWDREHYIWVCYIPDFKY
jgi:hypothetical protein